MYDIVELLLLLLLLFLFLFFIYIFFLIYLFLLLFFLFIYLFNFFSPASTKPAGLKIVKLDILLPNKIGHCGGKNYVSGKVLLNATALPRWSDTESLW